MELREYSAGLMSQSFWFLEFKKVVKLRSEGMDYDDIKKKCIEDNLFGAAKEYRAYRMAGYVVTRVKEMDDRLIDLFLNSDLTTQKIINLLMILRTDRLFFEFLYEVYREKVILGSQIMEEEDMKVFFSKKDTQSELIAGWVESTKKKLRSVYMNYMVEANLISILNRKKLITPPILDIALERYLLSVNEEAMVKAITGER